MIRREFPNGIVSLSAKSEAYGKWEGISPSVVETVLWSICCFLNNTDSYSEVIGATISTGGDTDTTAAITGAISEALLGIEKLPKGLIEVVHDRRTWTKRHLIALSASLWDIAV